MFSFTAKAVPSQTKPAFAGYTGEGEASAEPMLFWQKRADVRYYEQGHDERDRSRITLQQTGGIRSVAS